jgi:hypothetical protein
MTSGSDPNRLRGISSTLSHSITYSFGRQSFSRYMERRESRSLSEFSSEKASRSSPARVATVHVSPSAAAVMCLPSLELTTRICFCFHGEMNRGGAPRSLRISNRVTDLPSNVALTRKAPTARRFPQLGLRPNRQASRPQTDSIRRGTWLLRTWRAASCDQDRLRIRSPPLALPRDFYPSLYWSTGICEELSCLCGRGCPEMRQTWPTSDLVRR